MNPLDFYELAKEIRKNKSAFPEALKRTAVGRIYYAIFLLIREDMRAAITETSEAFMYEKLSISGSIHSLLVSALKEVQPDNHFGNVLFGMGKRRRKADYEPNAGENWDNRIDDNINNAEELIQNRTEIQRLFSENAMVIGKIVANYYSALIQSP